MADSKITALPAYTSASANDVFPIVDVTTGTTKKINYHDLVNFPYGTWSSSTTFTVGSTSLAYPFVYTNDEGRSGITPISGSSRIRVPEDGIYYISYSAVGKTGTPNAVLDIWLAVNGSNVPRSNTLSRFVGSGNERIITVTYIYPFLANQWFELYYHSDSTATTIVAAPAATTPTRPASPSIITTINKIGSY